MYRRLPTTGLVVLLGALAWADCTAAKPPDLPLVDQDVLAPQTPLLAAAPAVSARPNPFPPADPATPSPAPFSMRPSARRMMASCLLFGVHPLLALAPTDDYLDFDDDAPALFVPPQEESEHRCTGFHLETQASEDVETPEPIHAAPKEVSPDDSTQSICPWMRQQRGPDRNTMPFDEAYLSHDVLHNLEMLRQARALMQEAQELGRAGRVWEALDCLDLAHDLCPGSRLDDALREAAADLFAPIYSGSPAVGVGAEEQVEPPTPQPGQCDVPSRKESAAHENRMEHEIKLKLAQPVTVNFDAAPLSEVIGDLRTLQNLNIQVDTPALQAEGISLNHPVSVKVENVSLKSTLNLILRDAHLTYVIQDGVLQITTEQGARGTLQTVVYAVADLLDGDVHWTGRPVEGDKKSREESLVKLITNTINPRDWSDIGGPGTIEFQAPTQSLVINQTADVQEQVADLLAALRRPQHSDDEEGEDAHGGCTGFSNHEFVEDKQDKPADKARAEAIMRECHAAMDAGQTRKAAALARQAFAYDPEQAGGDPLVYKLHLAGEARPAVQITPPLPPVDADAPAALDRLLHEFDQIESPDSSLKPEEESADPPHGSFEFGFGLDGSVQMFTQFRRGGPIWHFSYCNGAVSLWAAPDGGADASPPVEAASDDDSGD